MAIRLAIAAKQWDAAGVAAFALGELLGGEDAVVAAGALMLHQVRRSLVDCCNKSGMYGRRCGVWVGVNHGEARNPQDTMLFRALSQETTNDLEL